jgi:hypothetical protein
MGEWLSRFSETRLSALVISANAMWQAAASAGIEIRRDIAMKTILPRL